MPVTELSGTVFTGGCQTLVNTVNCVGVMGKGLAKEMKRRYPAMFAEYLPLCTAGKLNPGVLHLWRLDELPGSVWILNFPTKVHYRDPSQLDWIELGLKKFVAVHVDMGIESIAFPPLGCSNGRLAYTTVKPLMYDYLDPLSIPVKICTNTY